jgi:hypothetical protein
MISARSFTDAWRALLFLLLYATVASALATRFDPYLRVLAALGVSVVVFGGVDVLTSLIRGDRPLVGADGRLYSVRGLIVLVLVILVTAVTIDGLRGTTAFSEPVGTLLGFVVGVAVVLGPVVGYYWRRAASGPSAA